MIGAIVGDIVGSQFEFWGIKTKDFKLFTNKNGFTDDTVLTLAIGKAMLECNGNYLDLEQKATNYMREFGKKYPYAGYGPSFEKWLYDESMGGYNSFGNGSAMRISAVPYFAKDLDELAWLVETVTKPTHNHQEGIKGAMATATAIWLALHKKNKAEIKDYIETLYYNLDFDYDELIKNYSFNMTCQGSVPPSIYAFLISNSYEDTIRTAISMGGDTDTMGAIAGAIAAAYYGVPEELKKEAYKYLDDSQLKILCDFENYLK
ncbi:MAG: ADP-ribosylglycohydrolase family protein [Clostridia bacterium]|nr:ADP-ribosylglycohydrolase family protein [Clostridia bacterium]